MRRAANVADVREKARRRLPRALFDYIDGAAEDELTMLDNERAFREVVFHPRMGVAVDQPDLTTTVLGTHLSMPVLLAPCGLVSLMHPCGARGALRAAHQAGTVSVLSSSAGVTPEELATEPGPRWFQLYAADREIGAALIERVAASQYDALVVTVDTPVLGKRERDLRNGWTTGPLPVNLDSARRFGPQLLARPRWSLSMLRSTVATLRQPPIPGTPLAPLPSQRSQGPAGQVPSGARPQPPILRNAAPRDGLPTRASPFTWDDIAWIRGRWAAPLLVKGVLSAGDAVAAVDAGADAVIVSNHGGRQLESAPATLRVLPEIVDALRGRADVLIDGGVRRAGDAAKALALGAKAVLIGRAYLYALSADGEAGIARMLEAFRADLWRTMILLGCGAVRDLDRSWIRSGPGDR